MPRARKQPTTPPRLLLSIDAAAAAGLALFKDGELVEHAAADGSTWVTLMQALQPLVAKHAEIASAERLCVIEAGWLERFGAKSALTLERRRGLAQAAAEACGFHRFLRIGASTWQPAVLMNGGKVPKDMSKALSMQFVRDKYRFEPISDDESDAVCLGHYCIHYYV